jgi:hypothetical protein
MSTYHTVNFVSTTQYYLTVNGGNVVTFGTASPTGDQWYDSGGSTTVSSNGVYSRSGGTGQRVASWNLDGGSNTAFSSTGTVTTSSVSMSTYHTVNFNSVTQYQVTFVVSPSGSGSTSPAGTNVWEDTGSLSISTSANSGFSFLSWSSDTVSITFISTSSASTTATISGTGTITANFLGALDHFTFSTISNPQTAGVGFSVTVTAYDAYGNVETGFTGSVSLTESNGGTVTPSSVTISSGGQVTTTVSVSKVGTGVTLGAISGGKTGTSGPFDVTSGALDHFVFNTVGNQVAGSAFSVTITAADSQGNTVTSYTGTPMLSYSAGSVTPFSATGGFTAGVWTGSVTVTVAGGRVSLGVDDGSGHVGTSNLFAVTHASVATSIAVTPNPASVTAGGSQVFAATASDTYGNTWDVTASVTWSINATAGGFWVQSTGTYTAETASAGSPWTVTATLGAVSGTANLTVNPGDLNHFVFDTVGSQVAGSAFSVTITALDSQGNIVTSYGGMPTLSYSVGSVTPFSATGGFTDGVWTGDVTVTVAGASVSLGVDDGSGHTGESNLFDVDPTITASVGSHGSITPSRAIIVSYGANQTFIITPDAHYHVADVLVDNVSVGAVTSYTFYDVTGNHTISASFAIDTFTITVTSAHGSPTASALVNAGDSFNASVTSPESARTGHKWICTGYSIDGEPVVSGTNYLFTNVQSNHTITFEWVEQFYITVISSYGSPTESSQWVAAGSDFTVSVTTPESAGSGHQYVANATSYNIPSVSAAETVTFTWTEQYYLTISGNFGSVSPVSGWYNAGSIVDISASATNSSGERFLWNGWTGTGTISYSGLTNETSVTMNSPVSEAASWTNQYSLTMITNYGTTSPSVGVSWYDAGSSLDVSASAPSAGTGERYVWNGWTGTGSGSYTGTNNPMTGSAVTMNGPINETASWTHQYEVTFVVSLSGSGSTSPAGTNVWEDTGSLGISATANSGYSFSTWSNNTTSITFTAANSADTTATINGSGTITATFTPTTTTTYTVTFTQTGLPAGKSWSVTFNSVTQSSTTSAIVFKSIASGSYSWSVLTPIAGSTGIRYQAYRASGTMSVPSQTTQTITYTISSQLSTTTTSTSSSTTQSTTSSSPTPTPTRSPSPSTTPTASPSPIVEFPNQLLEITLVVSMMIVLSAVVIAQKRKTGKIQSG